MKVDPSKDKVPIKKTHDDGPSFQKPPKKNFADVMQQTQRATQKPMIVEKQLPPPPARPPMRPASYEDLAAQRRGPDKPKDREKVPPKQEAKTRELPGRRTERHKESKDSTKEGATSKSERSLQAIPSQTDQAGASVTSAEKSAEKSGVSKIIEVFETHSMFESSVSNIQISSIAQTTSVSVMLHNGVEVNVDIAPGGTDLNIQIRGISEAAQIAIDNATNQSFLRARLLEKGFTIHKIETSRAEGTDLRAQRARQHKKEDRDKDSEGRS